VTTGLFLFLNGKKLIETEVAGTREMVQIGNPLELLPNHFISAQPKILLYFPVFGIKFL
jgi:hypothetical protein